MKYKESIKQLLNIGNNIQVYAGHTYIEQDSSYDTAVLLLHYSKKTSNYSLLIGDTEIDLTKSVKQKSEQYIAQEDEFINDTKYITDETSIFIENYKYYTYDAIKKDGHIPKSLIELFEKLDKLFLKPLYWQLGTDEEDWKYNFDHENSPTSDNAITIETNFMPNTQNHKKMVSVNNLANEASNRMLFLNKLNTYSEPILEVIIPKLSSSKKYLESFCQKIEPLKIKDKKIKSIKP